MFCDWVIYKSDALCQRMVPLGVMYDIDNAISDADLHVFIKPVTEQSAIVRVGRFGSSRCAKLTFKGDCLPSYGKVGHFRHQVRTFIPRPMPCFKCQKIGLVKGVCRNSAVSPRCAELHSEDNCNATALKYPNCQEYHSASSKDCPQIKKAISILKQIARLSSTHKEAAEKVRWTRRRCRRSSQRKTSTTEEKSPRQAT